MCESTDRIKVLLVEDHLSAADIVIGWLTEVDDHPFEIIHVGTARTAVSRLKETSFAVVLLELSLPDSYGLETILTIRRVRPAIPIVVLTAIRHTRLADQARQWGVTAFLQKDELDGSLLSWTLRRAAELPGIPT